MDFGSINSKFANSMFRRVDDVAWDMATGSIGVKVSEGIATLSGTGDDAQISINMFDDMGMVIPAFAQSTPVDQIKEGDLIYTNGKPKGWVTAVKITEAKDEKPASRKFKLMTISGMESSWTPPKIGLLGFETGVMVLRSLFNIMPNGEAGVNNMQNMLMPLMMMNGGDMDFDSIIPFMLMSQQNGGDASGGMFGNNMMQMMMMSKMFGGSNSGKSFGGSNNFFDKRG